MGDVGDYWNDGEYESKPRNRAKKRSLRITAVEADHILDHLLENVIADPDGIAGYYSGNKEHYISRHKRIIAKLEELTATDKVRGE